MTVVLYNLVVGSLVLVAWWRVRREDAIHPLVPTLLVGLIALALMAPLAPGHGVFGKLQLAAWSVFAHLPILLLGNAWLLRNRRTILAAVFAAIAIVTATIGVDAFVVEPRSLVTRRIVVPSDQVDQPVRIAVLADIQTDSVGEHERRAIALAMEGRPDLVLLLGDYLQVDDADYDAQRARFRTLLRDHELAAPLGVYAVAGNIEWRSDWPSLFEGTKVRWFTTTTTIDTGPVTITALSAGDSFDPDLSLPARPGFHLVFGHSPDFALGEVPADLLLAGHTHGGQVQLPGFGPVLTFARVPRAWASGVTDLPDDRRLVVSRGVGMERGAAPRMRFLCKPEVVVIDVVPRSSGTTGSGQGIR